MQGNQDTSRATVVGVKTEDFNQVQQIIQNLLSQKIFKLETLLQKSQHSPLLKEEFDLIQSLFEDHSQLVLQMIQWMFQPHKIMARKHLSIDHNDSQKYSQPYQCKVFIEKNCVFYEKMYHSAKKQQIPMGLWLNFLFNKEKDLNTFDTSLAYFQDVMIPFICHEYHTSIGLSFSSNLGTQPEGYNSIMRVFPKYLTDSLVQICDIQVVFKLLYKLAIAGCAQAFYAQRANEIVEQVYQKFKDTSKSDAIINHLCILFNQIHDNIFNDNIGRATLFVQALVKCQITAFCIKRISSSFLCKLNEMEHKVENKISQQKIEDQEEVIQDYLKFLTILVTIYSKLYKDNKVTIGQSRLPSNSSINSSPDRIKPSEEEQIFELLEGQISLLIKSLSSLNRLVCQQMERTISFSSGQNIKPLTLCKLCYFQLLLQCLHIAKDFPQKFIIDMDSLDIFSLAQRYLSENRWNNIFHRTIEKIVCLLLVNNYNFFKKNNMEKSNMANSFLGFLTENFTNGDYIYLNTFNFTHQGNLHSLYKIAKTLAHQLNNNQILIQLFRSFQPWKKFVLHDLKKYEQITFDSGIKLGAQELQKQHQKQKEVGNINVAIDQADSIKKLISIIRIQTWPSKFSNRKKRVTSALNKSSLHKTSQDKFFGRNKERNSPNQQNKLENIKQLRLSYPPIMGKINLQTQQQDIREIDRIGKHFFARTKSSKQLQREVIAETTGTIEPSEEPELQKASSDKI